MKELSVNDIPLLLKKRERNSHKGTYGTVNAVVGSEKYRGAAVLATMGALRSGVGIARVCSVEAVCSAVVAHYPSAILLPLEAENGGISARAADSILDTAKPSDAMLIGCGIGCSVGTVGAVNRLIFTLKGKKVIDADGLNALVASGALAEAERIGALKGCIITPHFGEMSRLCGMEINEIAADQAAVAEEFSLRYGCVTVLKGSERTVIAVPENGDCELYVSRLGNTGLAKGGSGDVLAGLIAGLFAQGYTAGESAVLGVLLHGAAADICAAERSEQGMLPHELGEYVCRLYRMMLPAANIENEENSNGQT